MTVPERPKRRRGRASQPPAERIRFRTETGSIYEISRDAEGMRWRRLSATLGSGPLRNEGAELLRWPKVRVGERCTLISEPLVPPLTRIVLTSTVVAILAPEPAKTRAPAQLRPSFRDINAGDTVTRLLGGSIPMLLVVTRVDERFIYCGDEGVGYKFDRESGFEVDEEIGWGPQFGLTGSFLVAGEEPS
jgi:hypothetical protein